MQALHCLLRHLTVTDMTLELAVATRDKDPALAAIKYGAGWSAVGALTPFLEQHLRIKARKINVIMDPNAAEDRILGFRHAAYFPGRAFASGAALRHPGHKNLSQIKKERR